MVGVDVCGRGGVWEGWRCVGRGAGVWERVEECGWRCGGVVGGVRCVVGGVEEYGGRVEECGGRE